MIERGEPNDRRRNAIKSALNIGIMSTLKPITQIALIFIRDNELGNRVFVCAEIMKHAKWLK